MAILFITHKFPPSIGGMQKQSYELINGMRKRTKVYTLIQSPMESKILFLLKLKTRVKSMLAKHTDIRMVHCNDAFVASFCTWICGYKNIKTTATFHGLDITFPNRYFKKWVVPKLRKTDKVFAVSQATANYCFSLGFSKDKVQVIKNGVSFDIAHREADHSFPQRLESKYGINVNDKKIILAVGRPVKRKGFLWFVEQVLPKLDNDIVFILAGPSGQSKIMDIVLKILPYNMGHQLKLLMGYADDVHALKSKVGNRFSYLDNVDYNDLIDMMKLADLAVMPNIKVDGDMEGFGLVALEVGLAGTCVLASDMEGIQCAIKHSKNGYLLPSTNALQWKDIIHSLLKDPDFLTRKGKEAKAYNMANYSWDTMIENYYIAFEKLGHSNDTKRNLIKEISFV